MALFCFPVKVIWEGAEEEAQPPRQKCLSAGGGERSHWSPRVCPLPGWSPRGRAGPGHKDTKPKGSSATPKCENQVPGTRQNSFYLSTVLRLVWGEGRGRQAGSEPGRGEAVVPRPEAANVGECTGGCEAQARTRRGQGTPEAYAPRSP